MRSSAANIEPQHSVLPGPRVHPSPPPDPMSIPLSHLVHPQSSLFTGDSACSWVLCAIGCVPILSPLRTTGSNQAVFSVLWSKGERSRTIHRHAPK